MGLTIFYSGRLSHMHQLPDLVEEVADMCQDLQWHYDFQRATSKLPIQGIWFSPPRAEPIWLTFLSDGTLANPQYFLCRDLGKPSKKPIDQTIRLYSIVQYGGPKVHMAMISMMRYIVNTYFLSFEMVDESEYWETVYNAA